MSSTSGGASKGREVNPKVSSPGLLTSVEGTMDTLVTNAGIVSSSQPIGHRVHQQIAMPIFGICDGAAEFPSRNLKCIAYVVSQLS